MKRTIKFLALVSAFAIGLSTTATVAFAAIRKTEVPLYSNSGVFNEVDWTYKGDTASTTFKSKIKGDVAELNPVAWGAGWLCPWKPVKITADAPATLEFDILEMSNFAMRPRLGTSIQGTFADFAITPTMGFEVINAPDFATAVANGTGGYYNDRACTEPASGDSAQAGNNCWIGLLPTTEKVPNGYRLKFEIYSDGVLYASRTNLNADGTLSDVCEDVYAKGFFPQVNTDTEYWFGMNYWNDAPVIIDNFNVYGGGSDACRVNFTGTAWRDSDGYFWFHGRFDDIIKTGGFRVGPYEVENIRKYRQSIQQNRIPYAEKHFRNCRFRFRFGRQNSHRRKNQSRLGSESSSFG